MCTNTVDIIKVWENAMGKMKITTKLAALTFGSVAGVLFVTMTICFINFHNELKNIALENQETRIRVFRELLSREGGEFRIEGNNLLVGDQVLNGKYELPDKLKKLCGGTATIFMGDTRVSTNVLKDDGTRAVGTKLQGPARDAVFRDGKSYRGKTDILGVPYFTAYDPIKNHQGEIIGVLYAGVKESEFFAPFDKLMLHVTLLIILISGIVAGSVFQVIRLMVTKPIQEVEKKFRNVAEGDLTTRLLVNRGDEIGELAEEFNRFIDTQEKVVNKIKNLAIKLDSATQEAASGYQGLSQATQEQASAVEQVAATIEQMTASIKQNAMNAGQGHSRAKVMVENANSSSEASRGLVKAMDEISAASRKIGDIIVTVNEVAFQTNLLALNAAVEAARAGEHGKGFAVVAGEVRSLAQKSADAAKQIKTLIEDTVLKVKAGDEIAKKSMESLEQMIANIGDLSQSMDEIAASSAEQAAGVDEVNRALSQIDGSTQQNASSVEELASASDSMSVESRDMAMLVERFRTSHDTDREVGRKKLGVKVGGEKVKRPDTKTKEPASALPPGDSGFEEF